MSAFTVDLLLDNHQIVVIEAPAAVQDEVMAKINNAVKRGDWFSAASFEGCFITYLGMHLACVNCARVVGEL